jgi:polygalacturonase
MASRHSLLFIGIIAIVIATGVVNAMDADGAVNMAAAVAHAASSAATVSGSATPYANGYAVYRNVRFYGARGDGVTDDTAAIIRALTAARADQGSNVPYGPGVTYSASTKTPAYVFFPIGTYLITNTLPV